MQRIWLLFFCATTLLGRTVDLGGAAWYRTWFEVAPVQRAFAK